MERFMAYPSDMLNEADQLSSLHQCIETHIEALRRLCSSMQPTLKDTVLRELRLATQGIEERNSYLYNQCTALREAAEIYANAERLCLERCQSIGNSAVISDVSAPPKLRQGMVFNHSLLMDDWLAELVYSDQSNEAAQKV